MKARFEEGPGGGVKRSPGRTKDLMRGSEGLAHRRFGRATWFGMWGVQRFLFVRHAFAADLRQCGIYPDLRIRHTHHVIGHCIRLMLQGVIYLAYQEFRLYEP